MSERGGPHRDQIAERWAAAGFLEPKGVWTCSGEIADIPMAMYGRGAVSWWRRSEEVGVLKHVVRELALKRGYGVVAARSRAVPPDLHYLSLARSR